MSETKPLERQQRVSISHACLRQTNLSKMSETLTGCIHLFWWRQWESASALPCKPSCNAPPHTSRACGVWTARCHTSTHGTKPTASQNPTPCICQKRSASTSGKRTFAYIKNTLKSPSDFEGLFCSENLTCIVFQPHIWHHFPCLWTSGDYKHIGKLIFSAIRHICIW